MNKGKPKKEASITRSSAAEYLTFMAATQSAEQSVELRYEDENIWLTQKMMATLYDVSSSTINEHIKSIYDDNELDKEATIRKFRIVQLEGTRKVQREIIHYSLQMAIAVGFKVNNARAVQFRKWANEIVKDYTIQGWAMDDERLKSGGSIITNEYFDKLLERIREIRLSERMFYQKVTDIYATSIDYDSSAAATRRFFAAVQNKLHYSVHGQTAAELIYRRSDSGKSHMGLTSWEGAPQGKIHRYDVGVAKNYLSAEEIKKLQLLVSSYLDYAEFQASRRMPMTMDDWEKRLDSFLALWDQDVLQGSGSVTADEAKLHADTEFEKYRITQDRLFESDFDRYFKHLEESMEKDVGDEQD